MRVRTGGLVLLMLVASAGSAYGQGGARDLGAGPVVQAEVQKTLAAPEPPAWGTLAETAVVIGGTNLVPPRNTSTWNMSNNTTGIGLVLTGGGADWYHQVNVPSGAVVTKVTIEACDTTATGELLFVLAKGVAPGASSASYITAVGTTGFAAMPGCAFFTVSVPGGSQMLNPTQNLWVIVNWFGVVGAEGQLNSIRLFYRLQVSPAPSTATFSDVPVGNPLHRFVEALAASGITGGCGSGNYCPDAPLTRGQMAVFLAAALGLHFPN